MILVTVGSSNILFDRLFKIIDSLCDRGVLCGEDIIAQTGMRSEITAILILWLMMR